jgi:hypothetical protein
VGHREAVSVVLQRLEREKYLRRFLAWARSRGPCCLFWSGPGSGFHQDGLAQNQFEEVGGSGYFFGGTRPGVEALSEDYYAFSVSLNRHAQNAVRAPTYKGVGETKNA